MMKYLIAIFLVLILVYGCTQSAQVTEPPADMPGSVEEKKPDLPVPLPDDAVLPPGAAEFPETQTTPDVPSDR